MNRIERSSPPSALLSYFSLFTSVGTLLCCALPSLLVLAGLGASVASTLSSLPWLVTMSRNKHWTFFISGVLIGLSFIHMYFLAPRWKLNTCTPENPAGCAEGSKISKVLLWTSAVIYGIGFFAAFILGKILSILDAYR